MPAMSQGSGRRFDTHPRWPRESGGANCRVANGPGHVGRDHVGMQLHSMTEVEIESL